MPNQSLKPVSIIEKDKYLAFELNKTPYAISISLVKEIMEYIKVDPIPMSPDFIIGAINLRGDVIPVFDLSVRLGKPQQTCTNRTCIIIAECLYNESAIVIGLKVDMVTKVIDILQSDIDDVPSIGGQFQSRFVYGLAKLEDKILTILNILRILTLNNLELVTELNHAQLGGKADMSNTEQIHDEADDGDD